MAINVSSAKIVDDKRQDLLGKSVDTSLFGGVSSNTKTEKYGFFDLGRRQVLSGADLAGITSQFKSAFTSAVSSYAGSIRTTIDKLKDVESNGAFQGTGVGTSLSTFIEGVKDVAFSYIDTLQYAEQQIIDSVEAAYSKQDDDLSGDLKNDAGAMDGLKATTGDESTGA